MDRAEEVEVNIVTSTERVDVPTTAEGARAARGQASFAAALRDMEQSAAAMLAMPHVKAQAAQREFGLAGGAVAAADASAGPGLVRAEDVRCASDAAPSDGAKACVCQPDHDRMTRDATDGPTAVVAAALSPARTGDRLAAPDAELLMAGQVAAAGADDAAGGPEGMRAAQGSGGEGPQRLQIAARNLQPAPMLLAQPSARPGFAGTISNSDAAESRSSVRPETRAAPAAISPAQVVTHLAADSVAVAIRAALLDADGERELLTRLAAELGASGIGRYSIQLNGLRVAGPTDNGGQ